MNVYNFLIQNDAPSDIKETYLKDQLKNLDLNKIDDMSFEELEFVSHFVNLKVKSKGKQPEPVEQNVVENEVSQTETIEVNTDEVSTQIETEEEEIPQTEVVADEVSTQIETQEDAIEHVQLIKSLFSADVKVGAKVGSCWGEG